MTDEEAFMDLVRSNTQGELSPLEIGIHALECIEKNINRHSKSGEGLSGYAEMIGKSNSHVSNCKQSAMVYKSFLEFRRRNSRNEVLSATDLLTKSSSLVEIYAAPKECWSLLVTMMLEKELGKRELRAIVKRVREYSIPEKWQAIFLPIDQVVERGLNGEFAPNTVTKLIEEVERVEQRIATYDVDHAKYLKAFHDWLKIGTGNYSWDSRKIIQYSKELQALIEAEAEKESWHLGKWQDSIAEIKDNSIALLLTDPPYGIDYQSGRKQEKHEKIAGDSNIDEAVQAIDDLAKAVFPKLQKDAHVLIFSHRKTIREMCTALEKQGFVEVGWLYWKKNNHGMGNLKYSFAPQVEVIIHAVKGEPTLYNRISEHLAFDKVLTKNHPTEKPVKLLEALIDATTAKGEIVFDPFGGVASTLVAAKNLGRKYIGCEVKEEFHAIGKQRLG
jgi:site-specific DNA-methyltransferase (adenine-specific)